METAKPQDRRAHTGLAGKRFKRDTYPHFPPELLLVRLFTILQVLGLRVRIDLNRFTGLTRVLALACDRVKGKSRKRQNFAFIRLVSYSFSFKFNQGHTQVCY